MPLTAEQIHQQLAPLLTSSGRIGQGALTVTGAARISDGWESDVWSFVVRDAAGDAHDLILRIYQGKNAASKATDEFRTIDRLHQAGYPVPAVYLAHEGDSLVGGPFLIMERIFGLPLGRAYDEAPAERQQELAVLFVRLLADLHRLDWRLFTDNRASWESESPHGRVRRTLDEFRRLLADLDAADVGGPLMDWFDAHAASIVCERPAFTHGDFHPNNILVRDDGSAAVIDWSIPGIRDPRFDLAWTLLLVDPDPSAPIRNALVSLYEQLSGAPVRDLEFFEALAVGRRLLSLLIALERGGGSLGMRPGLEEALKEDLGYVRRMAARLEEMTGLVLPGTEKVLSAG